MSYQLVNSIVALAYASAWVAAVALINALLLSSCWLTTLNSAF